MVRVLESGVREEWVMDWFAVWWPESLVSWGPWALGGIAMVYAVGMIDHNWPRYRG